MSQLPIRSKLVPPAIRPVIRKGKATWTDSWFVSTVRGAIREMWFRWPTRNLVLEACAVEVPRLKKDGTPYKKGMRMYRCAMCLQLAKKALTPKQKAAKKAWTKSRSAASKAGQPLPPRPDDLPLLACIDHKEALVPVDGREQDWQEYIFALFSDPESTLHVLCDVCHATKSKEENAMRRSAKNV